MKQTSTAMKDLVKVCLSAYEDNHVQQKLIREFQMEYNNTDAIRWYTRDSFLYRQINKALRQKDICKLFAFRLFIADAYHQLKQKHEEQQQCASINSLQTTWRGQMMTKAETDRLRSAKGGLISVNSFFSTSRDYGTAFGFIHAQEGFVSVLFEIELDTSLPGVKPFVDTTSTSYMAEEGEILFMLGSIFRIIDVVDDNPQISWVKMKLCSDEDTDIKPILDHLKTRISHQTCIYDFAVVLFEMNLFKEAKAQCEQLLPLHPPDGMNAARIHELLGQIAHEQGYFDEALDHFHETVRLQKQLLPASNPDRAKTFMNLALTHKAREELKEALSYHQQALAILQRADGEHHESIAKCLNNMGILFRLSQPHRALACFLHALFIRRQYLPLAHADIAINIGNIGGVMGILGDHRSELVLAQQTLALLIHRLPSIDPQIALAHQNLGAAYGSLGRFEEGLIAYHKAAAILKQVFEPNHPRCIEIDKAIRRMFLKRIHDRVTTRMDLLTEQVLSEHIRKLSNVPKNEGET